MMERRQQEERKETRRANQARIARLISEAGTISKNELAAKLGLSMPTVLQHVKVLTEAGGMCIIRYISTMKPTIIC